MKWFCLAEKIFDKGYFDGASAGKFYREISISRDEFDSGEGKLSKRTIHPFVLFCRKINSSFPGFGKNAKKFQPQYQDAVSFLGWDLAPEEFAGATIFASIVSIAVGLILAGIVFFFLLESLAAFLGTIALLLVLLLLAGPPLISINFFQNFPLAVAKDEQTKALTFVPEIVGYMIMSMKLTPNLEKAVEFSAEHGSGKIANDFKRIIWDTQIGVFNSLSEALDDLAYRWGKFSDEFKTALMSIRASVLENTEAKRYQLLDKTMTAVLESVKAKMEKYARSVASTATTLFMLGVFLPLVLIIILPVGSAFSGQAFANPIMLVLIYNIVIPGIVFFYAWNSLKQRPPTYEVPKIPEGFQGMPAKWKMKLGKGLMDLRLLIALILVAGIASAFFLSAEGLPPKSLVNGIEGIPIILPPDKTAEGVLEKANLPKTQFDIDGDREKELISIGSSLANAKKQVVLEKQQFFLRGENDVTKYNFVMVLVLTLSICLFIYFYYSEVYRIKEQKKIIEMETEFKDSLYILASRMGENKPIEEAMKHAWKFLPNQNVSQAVFGKTVENIELLGMPLEAAVFDKSYGSLKNIPSTTIRSSMKLLVDSVQLGVNVASRSMISLSLQLNNSEKVNGLLKSLTLDMVSSMSLMVIFIAPMVLGITTALQKVVMRTLASVASSNLTQQLQNIDQLAAGTGANLGGLTTINPEVFNSLVQPDQFLLIVAFYVIEMVIIMTYYTTKIEEDNNVLVKMNIGRNLPIAIMVFILTVVAANIAISGFMGNSGI